MIIRTEKNCKKYSSKEFVNLITFVKKILIDLNLRFAVKNDVKIDMYFCKYENKDGYWIWRLLKY